jgi:GAF domain-containing protein
MDTADCKYSDWVDVAHLQQMGVEAAIDVPLISSGRVIGTLNTGVTDQNVYYPEVEAMLLQIASVLASAMEKDRLYELAMAAQEQQPQQQQPQQQEAKRRDSSCKSISTTTTGASSSHYSV